MKESQPRPESHSHPHRVLSPMANSKYKGGRKRSLMVCLDIQAKRGFWGAAGILGQWTARARGQAAGERRLQLTVT